MTSARRFDLPRVRENERMASRPERVDPVVLWARAGALATVSMFLGVAGHVTAEGLLPGPFALAFMTVAATVLAAALLARPASTRRIVALLVAGQAAVHVVLSATAGHVGDPVGGTRAQVVPTGTLPTVDGRRVGSLQDAWDTGSAAAVQPALPTGHLVSDLVDHAPMMAAHLAAAALVGLWLATGERCLWTLLTLLAGSVVRPLLLAWALLRAGVPAPARLAPTAPAPPVPRLAHLDRSVVRRGPPFVLCS